MSAGSGPWPTAAGSCRPTYSIPPGRVSEPTVTAAPGGTHPSLPALPSAAGGGGLGDRGATATEEGGADDPRFETGGAAGAAEGALRLNQSRRPTASPAFRCQTHRCAGLTVCDKCRLVTHRRPSCGISESRGDDSSGTAPRTGSGPRPDTPPPRQPRSVQSVSAGARLSTALRTSHGLELRARQLYGRADRRMTESGAGLCRCLGRQSLAYGGRRTGDSVRPRKVPMLASARGNADPFP